MPQTSIRLWGSSPVVGSSRNSPRPCDEGRCYVEPPAHAPGVGLRRAARGAEEIEALEKLARALSNERPRQVVEPADHLEVLLAGQVLVHRGELAGEPDETADHLRFRADVVTEHTGHAGIVGDDRCEDPHDRGLARPVRPEQSEHGSCLDLEGDAVDGAHIGAEALHELLDLNG